MRFKIWNKIKYHKDYFDRHRLFWVSGKRYWRAATEWPTTETLTTICAYRLTFGYLLNDYSKLWKRLVLARLVLKKILQNIGFVVIFPILIHYFNIPNSSYIFILSYVLYYFKIQHCNRLFCSFHTKDWVDSIIKGPPLKSLSKKITKEYCYLVKYILSKIPHWLKCCHMFRQWIRQQTHRLC